jgi:DNA polymerase
MDLADLSAEERWSDGTEKYPETIGEVPANAFITNVVKYRPPGNRTPTIREILMGAEALRKEWMAIGRPRLIVCVGATARTALTPVELRLRPGQLAALHDGKTFVYAQYHPAWGMRNGPKGRNLMEEQWEAMGKWIQENRDLL